MVIGDMLMIKLPQHPVIGPVQNVGKCQHPKGMMLVWDIFLGYYGLVVAMV